MVWCRPLQALAAACLLRWAPLDARNVPARQRRVCEESALPIAGGGSHGNCSCGCSGGNGNGAAARLVAPLRRRAVAAAVADVGRKG